MKSPLVTQFPQMRSFGRPARLFLIATVLDGIVLNIWWLFFNFYILERGFSREFLGLVNAAPSLAALLLGLPLGLLSDRIGRKKAMLLGVGVYILVTAVEVSVLSPSLILASAFIGGLAHTLFYLSQAPFMMGVSTPQNRTLLFSLNFGLSTLSGSVGNLFAGQLPAMFGDLLNAPADSAIAYQAVLLSAVMLSSLTLIPLAMIRGAQRESIETMVSPTPAPDKTPQRPPGRSLVHVLTTTTTIKLSLPNLLLGFGAAILIPYMNVFFREQFAISDQSLGVLFSLSSLLVGLGSVIGPRLAEVLRSKIRAVVMTQGASLIFLFLIGFAPVLWLAGVGYLLRGVLMNMAVPLFNAFAMEQVAESEQATVNSVKETAWQLGWAVGPYISGLVQQHFGFTPLFIATGVLYACSTLLTWIYFHRSETPIAARAALEAP
ncbi:MAG: MFS transporter [Anaerolineales bacterium]|nr:MFS transporter [Anaerolineales bacterium]